MAMFKVGDRVIIRNNLESIRAQLVKNGLRGVGVNRRMEEMSGKEVVIAQIDDRSAHLERGSDGVGYRILEDSGSFIWLCDFFESTAELEIAEESEADMLLS